MEAVPTLVVGGHGRSEAAFQNGLEHGVVTGSLSGEGPPQGHRQVTVDLVEPFAGFRPGLEVEAHGHDRVGHPGQKLQILLILMLEALLGRRRTGGVGTADLAGEVLATLSHPLDHGVDIESLGIGAGAVEFEESLCCRCYGVDVLSLELAQVGQAQERVADEDLVIDEAEGLVLIQGDEPQGEFAHLHGHLIDIHPVEAAGHHLPQGLSLQVGWPRALLQRTLTGPCLDELAGQESGRRHEESARAAGDVRHVQVEDMVGGHRLPLAAVVGLMGAG